MHAYCGVSGIHRRLLASSFTYQGAQTTPQTCNIISVCVHGVTICATIVTQKFDFYILIPLTKDKRLNRGGSVGQCIHIQMHLRCKFGDCRSV